jgi:hypothetical protein
MSAEAPVTDKTPMVELLGDEPLLSESTRGMDLGTFLDHVVGNAADWVRSLPCDKASGLRKAKAAVLKLTGVPVPDDLDSLKSKLKKMEKAVKAAMTNAKLKDLEAAKASTTDPVKDLCEKLKAAILSFCDATGKKGALAMLECLLGEEVDVETLESVFRHVAADDPAALGAFNALMG